MVDRNLEPIVIDRPLSTTKDLKKSLFTVPKSKSLESRISLTLQEELDLRAPCDNITLFPPNGEYEAPIAIRQPVTLEGAGATIWGKTGTVVEIDSDLVRLKNLRIEATDPQKIQCAIRVALGTSVIFENVEVRGMVIGIPTETGVWHYPESINLGQLSHGCEHQFKIRIIVPLPCQIIDEIAGLDFFPRRLQSGANEVTLRLERVPKDTLIFGSVFLVSDSLKRRMTVSAQVLPLSSGTPTRGKLIWEAKNWQKSPPAPSAPPAPSKIRRQPMPASTSWLIDSADRSSSETSLPIDDSSNKEKKNIMKNGFSVTNDTKIEKEGQNSPQFNQPSIPSIFLQENSS
ncbi:MAG: hypothetical protein J7647_30415 [Cyanobacteria bacterium SBLK]|nr:hypothetical protein [Cyanobacteria bacterium SBLK]